MSRLLLIAADANLAQRICELPGHDIAVLATEQLGGIGRLDGVTALLNADPALVPDMVVLGNELAVGEALSIAEAIDVGFPDVALVLVAEPDTDLALRAMRAGVRDVVAPSIGTDELKVLVHRAGTKVSRRAETRDRVIDTPGATDQNRVIVVASPKGGVGKSTIATNLCVALAQSDPMDVVLVDLDLQFGDAGILLNLAPTHTIADAFGSGASRDTLILKTFLTAHSSGFFVLCGSESPTISDKVTSDQIQHLIQQLSGQFRYVVVDTAAGLIEATLAAIEKATDAVFVSSMDVSSIRALRKEIDVLGELGLVPDSRHILLNFADRRSGLGVRDVESVIGMPIDVLLPRHADVPIAGNLGEPLMQGRKRTPIGKGLTKLASRIRDSARVESAKHKGVDLT